MLIRSIAFDEHPVLGNLALDFCDPDGNPFDTIIIAGENGTGKTVLLEAIHGLFNGGAVPFIKRLVFTYWRPKTYLAGSEAPGGGLTFWEPTEVLVTAYEQVESSGSHYDIAVNDSMDNGAVGAPLRYTLPGLPVLLSVATVTFTAAGARVAKGTTVDDADRIIDVNANRNLHEAIPQLLVDVATADALKLREWVDANPGKVPTNEALSPALSRFKDAFNRFMAPKRFETVVATGTGLEPVFSDGLFRIPIDALSTGEKQIVFRGGQILRDLGRLRDALVLVDEPELSLHPKWQAEIVPFLRALLAPGANGMRTQLIVATHSPFIVHGTTDAKVIILDRHPETRAVRVVPDDAAYPTAGAPAAVRAFNLRSFVEAADDGMVLLVEGKHDKTLVETAWSKLFPSRPRPFNVVDLGSAQQVAVNVNAAARMPPAGRRVIVGLFDFDGEGRDQWKGCLSKKVVGTDVPAPSGTAADGVVRRHPVDGHRVYALLLPVPAFRSSLADLDMLDPRMEIEHFFSDADLGPAVEKRSTAGGGTIPVILDGAKEGLVRRATSMDAASFAHFSSLFARLEAIRAGRL